MRSAAVGHHFAGPSNRFWKLLHESGLVPEPVTWSDDDRLPEWGFGITNLVARATPGIGDLHASELLAGRRALEAKVRRYRPAIAALVGVTIYRALFPDVAGTAPVALGEAPRCLRALVCSCCRTRAGAMPTTRTPRCSTRSDGSARRSAPAARSERPAAFGRRCIPAGCVASSSDTAPGGGTRLVGAAFSRIVPARRPWGAERRREALHPFEVPSQGGAAGGSQAIDGARVPVPP